MPPKFLLDFMLGRLARWLLLLGYDTEYVSDGSRPDMDAVAQAAEQERVFVTRDTRIPEVSGVRKVVLREQDLGGQLRSLLTALDIKPDPALFFTRCSVCNVETDPIPKEEGRREAPPKVGGLDTEFRRCRKCRKLYWSGGHVQNTLKKVKELLG